jgi:hypothetical protein
VESDLLALHLPVLDIDFAPHEHNGDVLADSDEVLVPLGHVLVGDPGTDIEHDDPAIAPNAIVNCESNNEFKDINNPY